MESILASSHLVSRAKLDAIRSSDVTSMDFSQGDWVASDIALAVADIHRSP
jgi:hypothetical protein